MNLVKNPIYNILHAHIFGFAVFSAVFGFVFFTFGFIVANGQSLEPNDSHIVSLFVNNKETTVPTRAETVGEFLDKSGFKLFEADLVEPGVSSRIDADNYKIHVYRAKPITIIDSTEVKRVLSPYQSERLIAEKAGFNIYPEDKLTLTTASNFVQENILGEKLIIDRATPVTLSLYGSTPAPYRTHASTVSELLAERKIVPEKGATVVPNEHTPIKENMAIYVSKFGKQVITTEEPAPFETIRTIDPNKPLGYKEIITLGKNGKKQVVYELQLRDGKEIGRTILQEVILEQPKKQEMIVGGKTVGFSGDFGAALSKLRSCEGAYTSNTGNGYYGAYQFSLSTWRSNAPAGYGDVIPSSAPPAVQDQAAATLYQRRGWQPWPSCSRSLGLLDIYR
jgi:uncharacterized protein YabE (DUF348 family)